MTAGPGKYDHLTTYVREQTNAELVIVIIGGGVLGDGFDMQVINIDQLLKVSDVLREVADEIEADIKAVVEKHNEQTR